MEMITKLCDIETTIKYKYKMFKYLLYKVEAHTVLLYLHGVKMLSSWNKQLV